MWNPDSKHWCSCWGVWKSRWGRNPVSGFLNPVWKNSVGNLVLGNKPPQNRFKFRPRATIGLRWPRRWSKWPGSNLIMVYIYFLDGLYSFFVCLWRTRFFVKWSMNKRSIMLNRRAAAPLTLLYNRRTSSWFEKDRQTNSDTKSICSTNPFPRFRSLDRAFR